MTDRETLRQRIEDYTGRLNDAGAKWGPVELLGVTKTIDTETINLSYEAGIRKIGENRVQELMEKLPLLDPRFERHIIGRLQTNKVKYLIGNVSLIQSVDRLELAQEINRLSVKKQLVTDILVQVSPAGEEQKGGIDPEALDSLITEINAMEGLRLRGLMAVMPKAESPEDIRFMFTDMRRRFDALREKQAHIDILSMGMSADCIVAAEEGATMVRLGSAIYGARDYSKAIGGNTNP